MFSSGAYLNSSVLKNLHKTDCKCDVCLTDLTSVDIEEMKMKIKILQKELHDSESRTNKDSKCL